MANRLTIWLLAALLLAAGWVTVRTSARIAWYGHRTPSPVSAARARASALASAWRLTEQSRRIHTYRLELGERLRHRAAVDSPTVAMLVAPASALSPQLTDSLQHALVEAWQRLGLGVTKVAVGVVLNFDIAPVLPGMPRPNVSDNTELLLLPDSLAPTLCLTMVPFDTFGLERARQHHDLAGWVQDAFDACAYYARFGVPGARVRHWLAARAFDLARTPDWAGGRRRSFLPGMLASGTWEIAYGLPPTVVACFMGRASACAEGLREGDGPGSGETDSAIPLAPSWRYETLRMVDGEVFLSRVLEATGPQRFLEFWNTTLPVDSALTLALRRPVGEWVVGWQAGYPHGFAITPRADARAAILSALEIVAAVGAALLIARRREVG